MARSDLTMEELADYRPAVLEPGDFDAFWHSTIAEVSDFELDVTREVAETPYRALVVHDVTFSGYAGDRIRAWEIRSIGTPSTAQPAVVEFIGYNGGRDLPGFISHWANAGYVHVVVDTRGQGGSGTGTGATSDPHGAGPHAPGFLTQGIEDPYSYYYRRVFTDAVRAVAATRSLPSVDGTKVAVQGVSQGGGIALAVAGLIPDLAAVMSDVPFLCHFRRAVDICDQEPYIELTRYLALHRNAERVVFNTLSYFDGVNHAKRASAPALISVALMDKTCPPSTAFAAFHAYSGTKEIVTYPFNDHEGGLAYQRQAQMLWLDRRLKEH